MNKTITIDTKGIGFGTVAILDGQPIRAIKNLEIQIPADGLATVTITQYVKDEQGQYLLVGEGSDREVKMQTLVFRGHLVFEGEAIGELA